jgi:hypothetical protein
MTDLLKKAFRAAARLPEAEQKALAVAILAEVASNDDWDARFAGSGETLSDLANEALAEYRRGETQPLDSRTL